MSKSVKVSVVTICYNCREALTKTMASVLAQDFDSMEYIVVDGASTDGSAELISSTKGIAKWISERDGGIYDAMNKGARMSQGEYVIFMNAGDTFAAKDTLKRVFSDPRTEDADVIYGAVIKHGQVRQAGEARNCHRMFFCHQSCLGRRQLLLGYPFDTHHRMSADFKWVKTMIKQGRRFVRLELPIAEFDTSGVSNTRRSTGLLDNIRVVRELDSTVDQLRLLPHLIVPYLIAKVRGK